MRLRCPKENCPIEVPDDLIGMRIRCPHCGEWLVVDPKYREASAEQIQAGVPDLSLGTSPDEPTAKEPVNLENQIYDGLPPLSVMLALRRQQAGQYDAEDLAARYPMTEDDWKALSAFESVLLAVIALRTTLVVGGVTLLVNLLGAASSLQAERESEYLRHRFFGHVGMGVVLGACFLVIYLGSQGLQRMKLDPFAKMLPWSALCVAVVVGAAALMNVMTIMYEPDSNSVGFMIFAGIAFNVITAFDSGKSALRVGQSLNQVSPPEISHRLTEALKYLE